MKIGPYHRTHNPGVNLLTTAMTIFGLIGAGCTVRAQQTVTTHVDFNTTNQSIWGAGQAALEANHDLTSSWSFDSTQDFTFDFDPGIPGTTINYDLGTFGPGFTAHDAGTVGLRHTIYSGPGNLTIDYPIDFTATTQQAGRHGVQVTVTWLPTGLDNGGTATQTMTVAHDDVNYGMFFIFDSSSWFDPYYYVAGTKYDQTVNLPWTLTVPLFDTANLTNTSPGLYTAEQFNPLGFSVYFHPSYGNVTLTANADMTGAIDAQNNPTDPLLDVNGDFTQLIQGLIDLADFARGAANGLKAIGDPAAHDPEHGQQGDTPNTSSSQILGYLGEALSLGGFPFNFQFDIPASTPNTNTDFGINWDFLDLHGDYNLTTAEDFHFQPEPYAILHVYYLGKEVPSLKKTLNLYAGGIGYTSTYSTTVNLGSYSSSQVRIVPEYFLGNTFTTSSNITSASTLQFIPLIADFNISADFFITVDLSFLDIPGIGSTSFDTGTATYSANLPQTYTQNLADSSRTYNVFSNAFTVQGFQSGMGSAIWP